MMKPALLTAALIAAGSLPAFAASAQGSEPMPMPARATAASPAALPAGVRKLADLAYGGSARQRIDVYLPPPGTAPAAGAPILVMVHGGAWIFGDKSGRGVVAAKLAHWAPLGWIFVSVNNRLIPEAAPLQQAEDVATAIAYVQRQAPGWGGDAGRLILMGHSAGAHLVALVDASPPLAARAGARPWAGTVALDSAALDLPALMGRRHARFYDRVFGADPAAWRAVSPSDVLAAGAPPLLLVCSTLRGDDSCGQSDRFAARATAAGLRASVQREALQHNEINADLGQPGAYTEAIDAFIASVLPPPASAGLPLRP